MADRIQEVNTFPVTSNKVFKRGSSFCSESWLYLQSEDLVDIMSVGV